MAEYIEREYVLKCMEDSYKNAGISAEAASKVRKWLYKAPAADVRPVITCGECIHGQGEKMDFWNEYEGIECIGGVVHRKDWFCADGAKREES